VRDTLLGVSVTAIVIMPVAVLGAAAPMVRADLSIAEGTLGLLVGLFFLAGAVASVPAGRASRALSLKAMMIGACGLAAVTLTSITVWAGSIWALGICLAAGGVANAAGQVSVNHWLARNRPMHRQGLSFGAKQAAVPLASLCAGLLLPAVIVPFGWRAGFLVGTVLALLGIFALSGIRSSREAGEARRREPSRRAPRMSLALLTGVGFLGAAGGTCLAPFMVDYLTTRGLTADTAGLLLSLGAAAGITARLAAGILTDLFAVWPLSIIAALLASGGVGIAMLAVGASGFLLVAAVMLSFLGAWGWPGLLPLALTRASPEVFRAGAGMIVMGPLAGAVAGPSLFGLIVERAGYPAGWTMLVVFVATAGIMATAVRARSAVLHPNVTRESG